MYNKHKVGTKDKSLPEATKLNFLTFKETLKMTAAQKFLADFDGFVDALITEDRVTDVAKAMPHYGLKRADIAVIEEKLQPKADELELVVLDTDPDLMEGWANVPKAKQKQLLDMYFDALSFKVVGKSRAKKVVEKAENGAIVSKAAPKAEKTPIVFDEATEKATVAHFSRKYNEVFVFTGARVVTDKYLHVQFDSAVKYKVGKDFDFDKAEAFASTAELFAAIEGKRKAEEFATPAVREVRIDGKHTVFSA